MTVEERFNRELERFEKSPQETDRDDVDFVMDYSPEQYKSAFHRAVVDHALQVHGASFGRLEGRAILTQAEIVCDMIGRAILTQAEIVCDMIDALARVSA